MNKRGDTVKIADASQQYDEQKPGSKHRVTLYIIAKRNGVSVAQLWNFRRGMSRWKEKVTS